MGYQSSLCQAMPGIKFFVYIFIISLLSPVPAFLTVRSSDLWGSVELLPSGQRSSLGAKEFVLLTYHLLAFFKW